MLDGVTLDQLRTFMAAADEGSYLGRRPQARPRPIGVVSQVMANLEGQIGV